MSTLQPSGRAPRADLRVVGRSAAVVALPERSQEAVLAERRAWLILWLAFATFLTLVIAAARFGVEYVTTADIDLTARVESVQGIAFTQAEAGRKTLLASGDGELLVGTSVEAARAASAVVRFFEASRMTVLSEARVDLVRMDQGRFTQRRTLVLRQRAGPVWYEVASAAEVEVPNGLVRLSRADGQRADATVWVEDGRTRVLVYDGEARLESNGSTLVIRPEQRGELTPDGKLVGPSPRAQQLLVNHTFSQRAEGWEPHDVQTGPKDVHGERIFAPSVVIGSQQLPALRIVRESQTLQHGETGLRQALNLDVWGYRSLYVEAWVRVDGASLSGGGQLGSEYPMMLRTHYEGPGEGSRPDWVAGFYDANPENRPVINAQQVPTGEWVRYRVDLMQQESSRRPYRLLDFEVLGQGHSYDAWVADVRLIGD